MLVSDRQTRPWLAFSAVLLLAGGAGYALFQARRPGGPSGGGVVGISYGALSLAMMTFAMLLALRKRLRTLRIGRTYWWMQGHVWLGLLAFPFALFHSGFKFGPPGTLAGVIMWLFTLVVVSGVIGLVFQNIIPSLILRRVQRETVYEQHDHVLGILRREVAERIKQVEQFIQAPVGGAQTVVLDTIHTDVGSVLALQRIRTFEQSTVLPFLADRPPKDSPLRRPASSASAFKDLCSALPGAVIEPVNDIEQIVGERRQMLLHRSLHHWLHIWLLVHVPISYALFVLVILHAVFAWRFR